MYLPAGQAGISPACQSTCAAGRDCGVDFILKDSAFCIPQSTI